MFPYQKRHSAQLLEASRLTQAGQLLEATALIQQTLQGALAPDATPTTTEPSTDAPFIEGSFRVVEPETTAGEPSVRKPKPQEVELTILTLPTPTKTETASNPKQTPIYPVDPCSDAPAQQQTSHAEQIETWPNISNLPLASHLSRPLRRWKVKQSNVAPASAIGKGQYKGQFLSQTYTNEAGTRPYKLYLPNRYQGQAWPLLVLLHGCSQSPDDIAAGSRMNELAETHSFLVLYPGQTSQANTSKCWNWFNASEQQRDRGEPALIAGLTRQILTTYGLDTQRVYVAGISAGGAMAMVMGSVYPDLYAAIGVQSGLAYGLAHDVASGFTAMKQGGTVSAARLRQAPGGQATPRAVPTIVFHGDADSIVNPNNSEQIITQWLKLREGQTDPQMTVQQGRVPNGHAYTHSVYHDGSGPPLMERWLIHGAGHAWSGGSPNGSWTDPKGPDASQEMLRFFSEHSHPGREPV